ncbi:hypothetical protein D5018_08890 [Parashewanella curva]|uniref:Uncharacterized protein n=1 Tax=Parashewanella curva TaxID=2338552 RepID=A0A3L8Q0V4_9GAMM|nr:hypothetical protein [Parashewanella curva]RLV60022.1 hypothetical protein D5018_08890 [Parashewanella curva]
MLRVNARGPIARKVISKYRNELRQKVVSLNAIKQGKTIAEEMLQGAKLPDEFEGYDPLHAVYVYGQNQLSIFAELFLTGFKEIEKLGLAMVDAEDEFQPSYPPMSPVTNSYFFLWQMCDLSTQGAKKESMASIVIDFLKHIGDFPLSIIQVFEAMEASRNGIYLHQGFDEKTKRVLLKELITGQQHSVHVASGYQGEEDEVWICRLLSSPFNHLSLDYSVAVTTPYVHKVLPTSPLSKWLQYNEYMQSTMPKSGIGDPIKAYEHIMKYGLHQYYWLEIIFEAYSNYDEQAIYIYGSPAYPQSFPHFCEEKAKAYNLV